MAACFSSRFETKLPSVHVPLPHPMQSCEHKHIWARSRVFFSRELHTRQGTNRWEYALQQAGQSYARRHIPRRKQCQGESMQDKLADVHMHLQRGWIGRDRCRWALLQPFCWGSISSVSRFPTTKFTDVWYEAVMVDIPNSAASSLYAGFIMAVLYVPRADRMLTWKSTKTWIDI